MRKCLSFLPVYHPMCDKHERRSELWRGGWALLADGLTIVLSGGFLNNDLSTRSFVKSLKAALTRQERSEDEHEA